MVLDELAAAVVGLNPGDLETVKDIQNLLLSLRQPCPFFSNKKNAHLLEEAIKCSERLLSRDHMDEAKEIRDLNQWIVSLQKAAEESGHEPELIKGSTSSSIPLGDENPGNPSFGTIDNTTQELGRDDPPPGEEAFSDIENDPEILSEFITESMEHIQNAETALLTLEDNPDDPEAIHSVFRAFHTIKGTSGFLCLEDIQRLAHGSENLLSRAREGEIRITGNCADLALESIDMLKQMIQELEQNTGTLPSPPDNIEDLMGRLRNPEDIEVIKKETEKTEVRVGDILVASGIVSREKMEEIARSYKGEPIGEALVKSGVASAKQVAEALRTQEKMTGKATGSEEMIRVSTQRLDRLINSIGELVITHTMIGEHPYVVDEKDPTLSKNCSRLSKIIRELQDLSVSMRMVPLRGLFNKMNRLVRDLSRKSGKEIKLIAEGEDTEIDRSMVELLKDPLVHMIRNAVDHGIESRDERKASAKPEAGHLYLRAYHNGEKVVIELEDDGRGLDRDKILAKALEKGLVEKGKEIPHKEILQLIFAPGFSTADRVTEVSGRGVGMDVVKKNIEAMRGHVEISTVRGERSKFSIRLPLTLAIIDGMLLGVGNERFVLPIYNVNQAIRLEDTSIFTVKGRGEVLSYRNRIIPLLRLGRIFRMDKAEENSSQGILVVVEHEGEKFALLADDILGQKQIVIKPLNKGLGEVEGLSGGAILGDGRVGLILDVEGVIRLAQKGVNPHSPVINPEKKLNPKGADDKEQQTISV